jgi:hypothetical protein
MKTLRIVVTVQMSKLGTLSEEDLSGLADDLKEDLSESLEQHFDCEIDRSDAMAELLP